MRLSKRIEAIVDMCPYFCVWADIGADHGLTAAGLIMNQKAKSVIATDISAKSLSKAAALREKEGFKEKMLLRAGDGLKPVTDGLANGAVISGMGADVIISILKADKATALKLNCMILSPNSHSERLREYLTENGFKINAERVVEECGKYYPIMLVCPGTEEKYSEKELVLGRHTEKDADFYSYTAHKAEMWSKIQRDTGGLNAHASHMLKLFSESI